MHLGVLLDHLRPPHGGAEAHTHALMRRAVLAGDTVTFACIEGQAPEGVETIQIPVPRSRPERDQRLAEDGVRALRDADCDRVLAFRHVTDCDVYLPHGGLVADAQAAKDRAKGGLGFFGQLGRNFNRKHAWFVEAERELLSGAEGPLVIAVSHMLAARIKQVYPSSAERVATVINGVDPHDFDPELYADAGRSLRQAGGIQDDALVLLLAAHNPVLKGVATVVEALDHDRVRGLAPEVHLLVAGAALPKHARRAVRAAGLQERVHVLGACSDMRPVYAAADLLVHPTWYDPCSLVCLEALSMRLPVITTPQNGVRDVMGQRGGIVIESPGDPEAVAVAIAVLADSDLRQMTADDARYLALRNRAATRLDRVLELCRRGFDPDAQEEYPL